MTDKLWETIDFNNHAQVCKFLQKQSDRITELEKENKALKKHSQQQYEIMTVLRKEKEALEEELLYYAKKYEIQEHGAEYPF